MAKPVLRSDGSTAITRRVRVAAGSVIELLLLTFAQALLRRVEKKGMRFLENAGNPIREARFAECFAHAVRIEGGGIRAGKPVSRVAHEVVAHLAPLNEI